LIAFKPIDGSHNATCLSTAILDAAEEFGIQNHIQVVTSDNASVNSATFKLLEESDRMKGFQVIDCTVSCMAHALNLTAQRILEAIDCDQNQINENELSKDESIERLEEPEDHKDATDRSDAAVAMIFRIARKIVAKIRTSNIFSEALASQQAVMGLPTLRLIWDCCTRWNSIHAMVQRLIKLQPAMDIVC
ncbi:hypothetical protein BDD12DRAFT_645643, partial [Trichophaea hybrida]